MDAARWIGGRKKNPSGCETRGANQEWQVLSARSAVVQVMLPAGALNATSKRPRRIRLEQARQPPCLLPGQPDIGSLLGIRERIYATECQDLLSLGEDGQCAPLLSHCFSDSGKSSRPCFPAMGTR